MNPTAAPVAEAQRHDVLDTLRGLALFGVLLVNLRDFYLAQSALGIAVFYGIGLGVGPRFGLTGTLLVAIVLFALQTLASRWWLLHFRFGPAEWAWRSLTYGRRQPLRRRTVATASAAATAARPHGLSRASAISRNDPASRRRAPRDPLPSS